MKTIKVLDATEERFKKFGWIISEPDKQPDEDTEHAVKSEDCTGQMGRWPSMSLKLWLDFMNHLKLEYSMSSRVPVNNLLHCLLTFQSMFLMNKYSYSGMQ